MIKSTPSLLVLSKTSSDHLVFFEFTTKSAPNCFNLSNFSGFVDVPKIILASKCFAICKPIKPTPELAP